jgi:hypothetical protein
MSANRCKATSFVLGHRCRKPAASRGYCWLHSVTLDAGLAGPHELATGTRRDHPARAHGRKGAAVGAGRPRKKTGCASRPEKMPKRCDCGRPPLAETEGWESPICAECADAVIRAGEGTLLDLPLREPTLDEALAKMLASMPDEPQNFCNYCGAPLDDEAQEYCDEMEELRKAALDHRGLP